MSERGQFQLGSSCLIEQSGSAFMSKLPPSRSTRCKAVKLALAGMMTMALLGTSSPSFATEESPVTPTEPALTLELNSLEASERGCRFTFVVNNSLENELKQAAFELVLFDRDGMVNRITTVNFRDLPQGKTKVVRFDFSGVDCKRVGRVLINDATECDGPAVDATACMLHLRTETRTETSFGI